jgi:hypothetical protein
MSASSRYWKLTSSVGSSGAPGTDGAAGPDLSVTFVARARMGPPLRGPGARLDGRGRGAMLTGGNTLGGGSERELPRTRIALTVRGPGTLLTGAGVLDVDPIGRELDSGATSQPSSRLASATSSVASRRLRLALPVMMFSALAEAQWLRRNGDACQWRCAPVFFDLQPRRRRFSRLSQIEPGLKSPECETRAKSVRPSFRATAIFPQR